MPIDWKTIDKQHPGLAAIPVLLRDAARQHPFTGDQTLFRRGERPRNMLFVLEGEVRLLRRSPTGTEMILQRAAGGFIAEASLDAAVYHCDVVAASDGKLLLLPCTAFRAALDNDVAFNRDWIRLLAAEVRRQRARSERLSLNSAAERILHYLETESADGNLILQQTRKAWAAELGLTHEVLYRTLRQLRERDAIRIDGPRIGLRNKKSGDIAPGDQ